MLDEKIALVLKKIITPYFKKRVTLEERKPQVQDRLLGGRQNAYTTSESLAHMKLFMILQIYSISHFKATIFKILIPDGTKSCYQQVKFPMTRFKKSLYRMPDQLQTVIAMYEQEINQNHSKAELSTFQDHGQETPRSKDQNKEFSSQKQKN